MYLKTKKQNRKNDERNKDFIQKWILLIILIGTLLLLMPPINDFEIKAINGKISLVDWNIDVNDTIKLNGEWEFYQGELLEPKDFLVDKAGFQKNYFSVPNQYKEDIEGGEIPKFGYATLRLNVELPEVHQESYGIIIRQVLSASKVWVDGKLISSSGKVATNKEEAAGSFERQLSLFSVDKNQIEIVIQTSNYNNITGRIRPIIFGDSIQIKREYVTGIAADIFIGGALFITAIYHFALFYKRRKNLEPLYFGVFCMFIAMRNVLVGARLVYEIYPQLSFILLNRMAYLTVYIGFPFIVLYFYEVFRKDMSPMVVRGLVITSSILSMITIFAEIKVFNFFLKYYEIAMLAFFIYVLIIIVKAVLKREQGASIILFSVLVFLFSAINDMLLQQGLIHTRSLASYGFFVFIFSQSYMLAAEFSDAFNKIENLVEENKAVYNDVLTGICNRRGFYVQAENRLRAAKENGESFIIVYGDLNKFKLINDTFGHKEGDEALQTAAKLMKKSFRSDDLVARMSGDEFIALAYSEPTIQEVEVILSRIESNFSEYNEDSNKTYDLSIGLGYALYTPEREITLDELINEADVMLYRDKEAQSVKAISIKNG